MIRHFAASFVIAAVSLASLATSNPLLAARVSSQEAPPDQRTRAEVLREQREEKSRELSPERVHPWDARLRRWEQSQFPRNWLVKGWKGFRPVFGGMIPGSGTVFGGGYIYGLGAQRFQAQANARFSTKSYTQFDGEVLFPPPQDNRRIEIKFRAQSRDLKAVNFFGLGNDSSADTDASFRLQDTLLGGYAWLNPRGLLSFGAEGAFYRAEAGSGSDPPSVEDVFPLPDVPGAQDPETDYSVVGGWVEFDIRDKWEQPNVGVVARLTGRRWDDTELNDFDFTRVIAEVEGLCAAGPQEPDPGVAASNFPLDPRRRRRGALLPNGDVGRGHDDSGLRRVPLPGYEKPIGERGVSMGGLDLRGFHVFLRRGKGVPGRG